MMKLENGLKDKLLLTYKGYTASSNSGTAELASVDRCIRYATHQAIQNEIMDF